MAETKKIGYTLRFRSRDVGNIDDCYLTNLAFSSAGSSTTVLLNWTHVGELDEMINASRREFNLSTELYLPVEVVEVLEEVSEEELTLRLDQVVTGCCPSLPEQRYVIYYGPRYTHINPSFMRVESGYFTEQLFQAARLTLGEAKSRIAGWSLPQENACDHLPAQIVPIEVKRGRASRKIGERV